MWKKKSPSSNNHHEIHTQQVVPCQQGSAVAQRYRHLSSSGTNKDFGEWVTFDSLIPLLTYSQAALKLLRQSATVIQYWVIMILICMRAQSVSDLETSGEWPWHLQWLAGCVGSSAQTCHQRSSCSEGPYHLGSHLFIPVLLTFLAASSQASANISTPRKTTTCAHKGMLLICR